MKWKLVTVEGDRDSESVEIPEGAVILDSMYRFYAELDNGEIYPHTPNGCYATSFDNRIKCHFKRLWAKYMIRVPDVERKVDILKELYEDDSPDGKNEVELMYWAT